MRKIIVNATITLTVHEELGPPTTVKIEQVATGGIKGTTENRTLDWTPREHKDYLFGRVMGSSRWVKLDKLEPGRGLEEMDFLAADWEGGLDQEFIQSYVENDEAGWIVNQIWGFQVIDGERRWARNLVAKKDEKILKEKLVYDWQGEEE